MGLVQSRLLNLIKADREIQDALALLTQALLIGLGLIIILQGLGFDVASLAIFASVLGVRIGFGLQNIANNFISGLIILFERQIRVGDFVKVSDLTGTVERIGIRSTEVRTLDYITIIVPNSEFVQSQVVNWSHGHPVSRLHIPFGVAYGSEIRKVRTSVLEAAKVHPEILRYPQPQIWFDGFGDSSLDFKLLVWIREPRQQFRIRSDLYYLIEANFRRYNIEIPFPQQDIHLRSPHLQEIMTLWNNASSTAQSSEPTSTVPDPQESLPSNSSEDLLSELIDCSILIRLKGPRQMGKTSLLRRILHHAKSHNIQVVTLSLHRVDQAAFEDLDQFLRWFCTNLSYQLGIPPKLEDYWNPNIGSKVSCTIYLEAYLLKTLQKRLVIALDEVNDLFQFSGVSGEFLPLLRSWYEDAKEIEIWRQVRWILAHATDVYVPLQIEQSPFNVGLAIALPDFTVEQVQDLARRHHLEALTMEKLMPLLELISCRPGLVRLALHHLSQGLIPVEQLIAEAHTQSGIYSDHLRHLLAALYPHQELQNTLLKVIQSDCPIEIPPLLAYRLESLGVIQLKGNLATVSCELYRKFFAQCLKDKKASIALSE